MAKVFSWHGSKERFTLLKQKDLLQSRVFKVREEHWRGPEGNALLRHSVIHPGAVAILPFHKGKLLMIRQFRTAVQDWLLEIPAGTLEKGEKPLACARREIVEETGFAARKWVKLGAVFTAPGFCSEKIHLYKASDLKPAYAAMDDDECIALEAMTEQEVRRAVLRGRIQDAKTLSALLCWQWR